MGEHGLIFIIPQMGKGGSEGQPFAVESKNWLESQILGKTVYCQLLKRETMYGRMVRSSIGSRVPFQV